MEHIQSATNMHMTPNVLTEEVMNEAIDQTVIDTSRSTPVVDANDGVISTFRPPKIKPHPTNTVAYITVSDPMQITEGLKKYTVYRVTYDPQFETTDVNNDGAQFLPVATATQHRYSSFRTLYNLLLKEKPGAIVMKPPEKLIKDRFSPECLEERRYALELFLRRIVSHPELRSSNTLKSFFDDSWNTQKGEDDEDEMEEEQNIVIPKASKTSSIKKWIKDKKTCLSGSLHRSPLDGLYDEMEHYVSALEEGLRRLEVQAEVMRKNVEREGSIWMEIGLGCNAIGHVDDYIGSTQIKENTTSVGHTFHTTSQTADALSTLYQNHHDTLLNNVLLPLRDRLKIIHGAKLALTKRSNRRVTYSTALSNLDSKKALLHKYRITRGLESKVLEAEASLSKAAMEVDVARREYDEVSERVLREFDRFKSENVIMMHETIIEFGRVQRMHSEEVASVWRLQKVPNEVGDSGKCYVDAARVLMEANSNGEHIVEMPVNPPPAVPETETQNSLMNEMEALGIQGNVKYRDPLPEE